MIYSIPQAALLLMANIHKVDITLHFFPNVLSWQWMAIGMQISCVIRETLKFWLVDSLIV